MRVGRRGWLLRVLGGRVGRLGVLAQREWVEREGRRRGIWMLMLLWGGIVGLCRVGVALQRMGVYVVIAVHSPIR